MSVFSVAALVWWRLVIVSLPLGITLAPDSSIVRVSVRACTCVRLCECACVYLCLCVYIWMHECVYVYVCLRSLIRV